MNGSSARRDPAGLVLAAAAVALVAYAAACKALLFHDLEYRGSDLYSCLDMSRSWFHGSPLLYENAYGHQAAIHNFYLLLAFSPLTLPLGAHGLFLGLAALQAAAAARAAITPALDLAGRTALLAGLVSPLAFYAFDDRGWGFHPELCYPPLAVLFALALVERRPAWAAGWAALLVLVKEDGALLGAGLLAAHAVRRLWLARDSTDGRRSSLRGALLGLGALALAFAAGLALLWWTGRGAPAAQTTAGDRIGRAVGILARTLAGAGDEGRRADLALLCAGYAGVVLLLALPLGRRLAAALPLLALAVPPVGFVLVVSDAHYKFTDLLWAPRVATAAAVVLGCVAVAAAGPGRPSPAGAAPGPPGGGRSTPVAGTLALVLASWTLQLAMLARAGYSPASRLDLAALWSGEAYAVSSFTPSDLRAWRCLGRRLPPGLPVSPSAETVAFFHRQTIVFKGLEQHAAAPAAFRVEAADGGGDDRAPCTARLGRYRIRADCEWSSALTACTAPVRDQSR